MYDGFIVPLQLGAGAYMMLWRLGTQYGMIFIGTEI